MNTKPAMICKVTRAGHSAHKLARYIAGKSVYMKADLGFGIMSMRKKQIAWAIDALRSFHGTSRACEVRHIIFSTPKNTPRRTAKQALKDVWLDWVAKYAPGRPWLLGFQFHNGHYHAHAEIANVDSFGKPIKMKPHQVVEMSDMKFTDKAISSKGEGKKGVKVYTKARNRLEVQDLAELLAAPGGGIKAAVWKQLKDKGLLTDMRERKDGSVVSFAYRGRRMTIATLEGFIARVPAVDSSSDSSSGGGSTAALVAPKTPSKPLADDLAAKLSAAGFTSKDLAGLRKNLRSVGAIPSKTDKAKNKTKQPKTPRL